MGLASKLNNIAAGANALSGVAGSSRPPQSQLPTSSYAPTPLQQQSQPQSFGGAPAYGGYGKTSAQYSTSNFNQPAVSYGQQQQSGQQIPQQQWSPPNQLVYAAQADHSRPAYAQTVPQAQYHDSRPPNPSRSSSGLFALLDGCVRDQNIGAFYTPQAVQAIADLPDLARKLEDVAAQWQIPVEMAYDLVKLALFDTIILVDDSGSMSFEEGGDRINDLRAILEKVVFVVGLFDLDGISVRFLNSDVQGNGIRSTADVHNLVSQIRFTGITPLGTSLERKVLEPYVLGPARASHLRKPVLAITITDGAPQGESKDKLFKVIRHAKEELQRTRYGPDAISFEFVQVGNDIKAREFLGQLDRDVEIGGFVDCTSNYELEADEMARIGVHNFSPGVYLMKLMLGAIDSSYDSKDERR
ncbi:hypothetical protein PYCC9005_002424 [Savitreella phatthalungensis]